MADWYYLKNGEQNGPLPRESIQELARSGQLRRADLVWTEGMKDWLPVKSVPELGINRLVPPADSTIPSSEASGQSVPNYLMWSIISNLCCFPPTGIVALIYSAKSTAAMDLGNTEMALMCANKAKMWNFVSLGIGLLWMLFSLVTNIVFLSPIIQSMLKNLPAGQ